MPSSFASAGRFSVISMNAATFRQQLDWLPGEFFDDSKLYLICSVHGALYAPDSGQCLGGRCQGKGLAPLPVGEIDGQVFFTQEITHG
jgi:nitrite reductase/ring-hydroxylating ferredoxin subunit